MDGGLGCWLPAPAGEAAGTALVAERDPARVTTLHRAYRDAGARWHRTSTFMLPFALRQGLGLERARALAAAGALALDAAVVADGASAADAAPLGDHGEALHFARRLLSLGPAGYDAQGSDARRLWGEVATLAKELVDARVVDGVCLETFRTLAEVSTALEACREVGIDLGRVFVLVAPGGDPPRLADGSLRALADAVRDLGLAGVGVGCHLPDSDPELALAELADRYAGRLLLATPAFRDGQEWAERAAAIARRAAADGRSVRVGGCCGTGPGHLRALARALANGDRA